MKFNQLEMMKQQINKNNNLKICKIWINNNNNNVNNNNKYNENDLFCIENFFNPQGLLIFSQNQNQNINQNKE